MQSFGFMFGNFAPEIEDIVTVEMKGFDGRRVISTGYRDVIWREFFRGDGGPACAAKSHAGFETWRPLRTIPSSQRKD